MSLFSRYLARCGKDITVEDRDEQIINGKVAEIFTNARADKAVVETLTGVTVFDGTNTEQVATHRLCLNWRSDVGAEQWVTLKGKRLRVLTAENYQECDACLVLMCTERGENSQVVNRA